MARSATIIHVSLSGNDRWSGRLESPDARRRNGPLATPGRALAIARRLSRAGQVQVVVHDGFYELDQTLVRRPTVVSGGRRRPGLGQCSVAAGV